MFGKPNNGTTCRRGVARLKIGKFIHFRADSLWADLARARAHVTRAHTREI